MSGDRKPALYSKELKKYTGTGLGQDFYVCSLESRIQAKFQIFFHMRYFSFFSMFVKFAILTFLSRIFMCIPDAVFTLYHLVFARNSLCTFLAPPKRETIL